MGRAIELALKELETSLSAAMNDLQAAEFPSFKRDLEIHPSGFPYCPLRDMYSMLNKDYSPCQQTTFSSQYFVNVGTLVHELIQRFMGRTGKVWGHWKCRNSKCGYQTKKISTYHACPECGRETDYEEIGYSLGDTLSGHQDCLYQDSSGNFWVVDYKTCLLSKAQKHAKDGVTLDGNNTYRAQQETYVALCQKRFAKFFKKRGIPFQVRGYILVYIPRDIPFQFQFVYKEVSDERKEEVWANVCQSIDDHNAILDAESFDDIAYLLDSKPCKSMKQYREDMANPYSECPLLGVCFNKRALEALLRDEVDDSTRLPLRKTIHLAIEMQNRQKGVLK